MLLSRALSLFLPTILSCSALPTEPEEYYRCGPQYGQGTPVLADVRAALAQLPRVLVSKLYFFHRDDKEYHIPFRVTTGGVTIFVEAPPFANLASPGFITMRPTEIVNKARYLIHHCLEHPVEGFPDNGFILWPLDRIGRYVTDPNVNIGSFPYPGSTAMVSVTVSTARDWPAFAEFDSTFPAGLSVFESDRAGQVSEGPWRRELDLRARRWFYQSERMLEAEKRGQRLRWFGDLRDLPPAGENRTGSGNGTTLGSELAMPVNVA